MEVQSQIKETIKDLPNLDDSTLIHIYKCSLSKEKPKDKALLKPLIIAIEKERRKRGTQYISSKPVAVSIKESE